MLEIQKAQVIYSINATGKDKHMCESDVAHKLLCEMLKKHFGIDKPVFARTENQKPYLCNVKNVFFSISHTQGMSICAVSDKNIGIDIEKIRDIDINRIKRISERFFTPSEIEKLKENNYTSLSFLSIWTKKEAYIKLLGETLSSLKKIDTEKLNINTYKDGEYVISVAKE